MSTAKDRDSVFNEPHLRPDAGSLDPSESKAERALSKGAAGSGERYENAPSVYDEPDFLPDRPAELIDQDWSCSACGYNLRGLQTGHPCPECGHRELYRPAPRESPSYRQWLTCRIERTSQRKAWTVAIAAALLGGPWAAVAALFGTLQGGLAGTSMLLLAIVFAPVIEETMKIAAAAVVVEVRPYLFRRLEQLQTATIGSALLFAVIENILYLYVYAPNHTAEYALWRWTVCVAMHVGCTVLATRGLAVVWQRSIQEGRPPRLGLGFRALLTAIVLHAAYNAAAAGFAILLR
ncbi:hypothetical protein LCGC14_1445410 [marine sediment metagenome]|uniref:PrsW family intramembrane metalloprotease n=1 Tax=marine sediment metagenome TaxID=412755 RepID=A0A0F9LZX8_9ZZZZ